MIEILWSMVAAIAFTMSFIQLLFWWRTQKTTSALAAVMSLAASASAILEMQTAKTDSLEAIQNYALLGNAVIFVLIVSLVWFVHFYIRHDRVWLAWLVTGLWTIGFIANFAMPGNLTFSLLTNVEQNQTFWGEVWYQPVGEANPLRILTEIATLVIIFYVADASRRAFTSGARRRAVVAGSAILFFITAAGLQAILVDENIVSLPYMISWAFVAITVALGVELVNQASQTIRVAEELKASNRRWRTLVDNVDLGVIGTTSHGDINYANHWIEALLGSKPGSLIGRNIVDLTPISVQVEIRSRIEKGQVRRRSEFPLIGTDGTVRNLTWATVPIANSDKTIAGYLAIVQDISALKSAEEDLRSSERAIERFDRAAFLVELASGFAHELNQPLAAILSNAQAGQRLLDKDDVPHDELRDIFDDIADDDIRAGEFIKSMRRLLQQSEMQAVRTDLADLFLEVQRILAGELLQHRISMRTSIEEDIGDVQVGRIEIQQVLMNLMVNAINALQANSETNRILNVSARRQDNRVMINVSDNGPGIDERDLKRVFEPFYTTRREGLGMGLSISRRIVELHGGKLTCNPVAGGGAQFEFSVPLYSKVLEAADA